MARKANTKIDPKHKLFAERKEQGSTDVAAMEGLTKAKHPGRMAQKWKKRDDVIAYRKEIAVEVQAKHGVDRDYIMRQRKKIVENRRARHTDKLAALKAMEKSLGFDVKEVKDKKFILEVIWN